ncbi:hypothetical protein BD779DRAFT_1682562 [Infundibulicybe gibba]|nr:hypothetical protein BD779DRAFT_1682562 [Infundibulicybe gibba]
MSIPATQLALAIAALFPTLELLHSTPIHIRTINDWIKALNNIARTLSEDDVIMLQPLRDQQTQLHNLRQSLLDYEKDLHAHVQRVLTQHAPGLTDGDMTTLRQQMTVNEWGVPISPTDTHPEYRLPVIPPSPPLGIPTHAASSSPPISPTQLSPTEKTPSQAQPPTTNATHVHPHRSPPTTPVVHRQNPQNVHPHRPLQCFITLGRGISKAITLFDPLALLVKEADRREGEEVDIHEPDDELVTTRNRQYKSYQLLLELIPGLYSKLCSPEPDEITTCLNQLQCGAKNARGDDIGRIKACVATWLNTHVSTQPPLDPDNRSNRGLQHNTTGRLLCPIEIRAKVRAGEEDYHHSSSFFARCFYSGYSGDPSQVSDGFLQSQLLLKTYAAIFTSPSSAKWIDENVSQIQTTSQRGGGETKSNVATRLCIQCVTPRTIAYSALHFSLTDARSWKAEYNGIYYPTLYHFIIDYFEDASLNQSETAHVEIQTLLKWWNKQIFPGTTKSAKTLNKSKQTLRAQRLAD